MSDVDLLAGAEAADLNRGRVLLEGLIRDAMRPADVYSRTRLARRIRLVARALEGIDRRRDARNTGARLVALATALLDPGWPVGRTEVINVCHLLLTELPEAVKGA